MDINGIRSSAPLFKKMSESDLSQIISNLQSASHHYADDSGKEWGKARDHMNTAAALVNSGGRCFRAMLAVHKAAKPLPPLDDFVDVVLREARSPHQ